MNLPSTRQLRYFVPTTNGEANSMTPPEYLADLISKVSKHPNIHVHLNAELVSTGGFKGNFSSILMQNGEEVRVGHGATIIATGGAYLGGLIAALSE